MKRIFNFPALLLVAIGAMFLVSCEPEPGGPTGPINVEPVVTLTSSSEITVEPTEVFTVEFSASKGDDNALKAVTIYEDGTKVPTSRLTVNGTAAAANPLLVTGTDVDGLTWTIDIVAQSSAATTVGYEIEVQDDASQTKSVFVNVTTVGTPPSLTSTSPMTINVDQDIKNLFRVTAVKGSGDLVSIEVRENDQLVDPSKIFWQVISMAVSENPFALGEDDRGGFEDQELYIMTPAVEGNFTYKVTITDEFGLTSELSFDVTTNPTGTPIDIREGVLLNSAGPSGTGGLDLDNGNSTGSMDTEAEIKDNGIDNNLPAEENWFRTISPISDNGVSMKQLIAGQGGLPEGFKFSDVAFKEDLVDFFTSGVDLTNNQSNIVQIEDVFIVTREGKYWMLEVIEIVTDPNGNDDSYKFDIKY